MPDLAPYAVSDDNSRGRALGVYNTTQAFGLFLGGTLGGWLVKNYDAGAVFLCGAALSALWLAAAATMPPVPLRRAIAAAPAAQTPTAPVATAAQTSRT